MKRTLVTIVLAGSTASAFAQAPTATPTAAPSPATPAAAAGTAATSPAATPEPPKAPPELAKLQFLVGDWVHEELHHGTASGAPGRGAARSKILWILGGHRLYITYKSLSAGGEHEGRGLLGWDAEEKAYRLDWFDNRGQVARYSGTFNPEEALVLAGEPVVDGQRVRQQLTVKKQPGGKYLLTDESGPADQTPKLRLESLAQPAPAAGSGPGATPAAGSPATGTPATGTTATPGSAATPTATPGTSTTPAATPTAAPSR